MFRGRLLIVCFALAAAGTATIAMAQQRSGDSWVLIGTRATSARGAEVIDVSKASGSFRALRLALPSGEASISNIEVRYTGGGIHNERRDIKLEAGERTRQIDPQEGERFLDEVTITFKGSSKRTKPALIEVYALQSATGAKTSRPKAAAQVAAAPPAPATTPKSGTVPTGGDVLFGVQRVGFGVDRDVIKVGGEIGKFDRIRLRAESNDIFLNEIQVIYFKGDPDVFPINAELKQNTLSDWLKLNGQRFIREISLTYRSRPNFKGQARVEVYGDYIANWLGPKGEARKYNQGWVMLGSRTAGFIGFDRSTIPVAVNEGGFKRVRVNARERAITLSELRIVYADGEEDIIPVKAKVEAGSSYGPIDLKLGIRAIKEIRASYRSRIFDKANPGSGAAIVEVWGQH